MPSVEEQYEQAARWAVWLNLAGYPTELHGTGEPEPFHREWRVFDSAHWTGTQVATIDIDGCGASWHGPDDVWLWVIGPMRECSADQ
jgi:hypothetical protein